MCCRQSRYCGGSKVSASARIWTTRSLRTRCGGTPNSFMALIVHAHLLQLDGVCHPILGEIVASVANPQFVVHTRNRVAQRLQLISQEEGNIGEHGPAGFRREIRFIWSTTPDIIARINRLHLGCEAGANARPEPVACDEQIGALTEAVCEMNLNAVAVSPSCSTRSNT